MGWFAHLTILCQWLQYDLFMDIEFCVCINVCLCVMCFGVVASNFIFMDILSELNFMMMMMMMMMINVVSQVIFFVLAP